MTYVIAEPCIGTKDTACVDVCPVDCIHPRKDEPEFEGAELLYIHPDECIDCGACEPACPVQAIFTEDDLHGTGRLAGAAVNAFVRVNVEQFGAFKLRLVLPWMNAIDRANVYACRVLRPYAG